MITPTEKYGYWESNRVKFFNKFEALYHASVHKTNIEFKYHNDIWREFDRTWLGKQPLNLLYKERAQQLRDKYQYLILYYSGGSDSHNILRTYIDNNIKLDEICVRWPKALLGSTIYSPNTSDKGSRNYWSEWDYAIKPILEWIVSNRPDIKITIKDYGRDPDKFDMESLVGQADHVRGGALLAYNLVSDSDPYLAAKGVSVGHIWGIDKPILHVDESNKVWMQFSDFAVRMVFSGVADPDSGEAFYWSPELPLLTFEMAFQTSQYYNTNKDSRKYLKWATAPLWDQSINNITGQHQNNTVKNMCYSTWDYRFQADKPTAIDRSDKFFWFYEHPEFADVKKVFVNEASARLAEVDDRFIKKTGLANQMTESFYIRTLYV